jgi:hypothetical protein
VAVPRLYVQIFGNHKKIVVHSCFNPVASQQVGVDCSR